MDLDAILSFLLLLLYWRVVLSVVASCAIAFTLVEVIPWLSGLQGIVLAALGFIVGVAWEEKATALVAPQKNPNATTSPIVAGATAIIVGTTWGIFSSETRHSFIVGGILFILGALLWYWYASKVKFWLTKPLIWVCITVATVSFFLAATVVVI